MTPASCTRPTSWSTPAACSTPGARSRSVGTWKRVEARLAAIGDTLAEIYALAEGEAHRDARCRRGPRAKPVEPGAVMERVTGIGGVFFRASDPEALVAWYAEHVGVPVQPDGYVVFRGERGAHVWAPFREDTDYWPAEKQAMVNFTVGDLDAMLAQLRDAGVEVDEQVEDLDGIGRFGWAVDPEGNRFELWEPATE